MIAKNYASNILNTLFGVSDSLSFPTKVYIGLCASEPYNEDGSGSVVNAGEPIGVKSYDRVEVSGKDAARKFFSAAVSGKGAGVITNNDDIQFKSARENYPETINYWFLSVGGLSRDTNGNVTGTPPAAFLWGKIKDVLFEKTPVTLSHFAGGKNGGASDIHRATVASDLPVDLVEGTKYIVYWNGEEHEETAAMYEDSASGITYTVLGNPYIIGGEDNGKSFGVLYREHVADGSTVYELTAGEVKLESVDSGEVAVYGINGIEVRRATVPTFYKGELQASIDV